jgi:hypothetical protein
MRRLLMDATTYDPLDSILDEYIGDELTWEDLQRGFSAFIEDQQLEEPERMGLEAA